MLTERFYISCPSCKEPVKVYAEPGEKVEVKDPPRCPDCKTSLAMELVGAREGGSR